MKQLRDLISKDYRVHMQLDNLPVAISNDRWAIVSLKHPSRYVCRAAGYGGLNLTVLPTYAQLLLLVACT